MLASHNDEIARKFCTKALWLEKGEIQSFGPTAEVLDAYLAAAEENRAQSAEEIITVAQSEAKEG